MGESTNDGNDMIPELSFVRESEEDKRTRERDARIAEFVKAFNKRQEPLYRDSIQCNMRLLLSDKQNLLNLKPLLQATFDAHTLACTQAKAFVDTQPLYFKEARMPVYAVKQRHYKIMEVLGTLHSRLSKQEEMSVLDEAIQYCEEALDVKQQSLIILRKEAKNRLIAMFDVFLLFRETMITSVASEVLGNFYIRLIFESVVLLKPHIVKVAFDSLAKRTALYQF